MSEENRFWGIPDRNNDTFSTIYPFLSDDETRYILGGGSFTFDVAPVKPKSWTSLTDDKSVGEILYRPTDKQFLKSCGIKPVVFRRKL